MTRTWASRAAGWRVTFVWCQGCLVERLRLLNKLSYRTQAAQHKYAFEITINGARRSSLSPSVMFQGRILASQVKSWLVFCVFSKVLTESGLTSNNELVEFAKTSKWMKWRNTNQTQAGRIRSYGTKTLTQQIHRLPPANTESIDDCRQPVAPLEAKWTANERIEAAEQTERSPSRLTTHSNNHQPQ